MKRLLLCFLVLVSLTACFGTTRSPRYAGNLVKQYGGEKTRPDKVPERFVILTYAYSKEKLSITYYKNGAYSESAMEQIDHLFRDRRAGAAGRIDPELIDFMVDIRTRLGLPPSVVFEVLSGYRSEETNAKLRAAGAQAAKESFHIRGLAVDFRIRGVNGKAIAEIAKTMQRGGVSFYPSSNHVHVDIGAIRTWSTR